MKLHRPVPGARVVAGLLAAAAAGCGGDMGGPDPDPGTLAIAPADQSGDLQAGLPGQALPAPLRVRITRNGVPVAGRMVSWQASAGTLGGAGTGSGTDGVASVTVTLPQAAGAITIQAVAAGATGSPVGFTAFAAGTAATVQVLNNRFEPQVTAVRAGGSVTFDWPAGSLQHNLVPDDGRAVPNEPTVRNGVFSVTVQFPAAGDYHYHCSVHGSTRSGMFGRIIVVP
jgi:plastocyanin